MPVIGCTKESNCKKDAFLKARQVETERSSGNPRKQGDSTDPKKIKKTTVPSNAVPDLPGKPDNVARYASGNKHLDKRVAVLEEPAAQKDLVEIPQSNDDKLRVKRAPREIRDSEFRESQDVI
ncbi:hypothetical protein PUN28_005710 [Cardiocondyla obscurior]|uniref:Uncharacterized protein n=1 Tax=Cardiocondyla obscurior TaxID=286306 RepID=A0AAW2G8R1_9HYME